jgi:nucleotide-binding universal stress UspA family protein
MAYKDILVRIDGGAAQACGRVAATLAGRAGGVVTGLYLKTPLIDRYGAVDALSSLPPEDLDKLVRDNDAAEQDRARTAAAALEAEATATGAAFDWRMVEGDAQDLVEAALCADLLVAPAEGAGGLAVDAALAGCAVLVVPEHAQGPVGQRALVAWNGRREAARALREALPLMAEGAVLEVRAAGADTAAGALDPLKRRLVRNGFVVNTAAAAPADGPVADWLKAEAAAAGCDLIVMGVYGHARLREFVMGGVSRDMLATPPLPLLIAH